MQGTNGLDGILNASEKTFKLKFFNLIETAILFETSSYKEAPNR